MMFDPAADEGTALVEPPASFSGNGRAGTRSGIRVKVLRVSGSKNHAQMRNEAVKVCAGDILAFIDDDVVVPGPWLRDGLRYFLARDTGAVGGPGTGDPSSFGEKCSYYTLASPFCSGFAFQRYLNAGELFEAGEDDLIMCNTLIRKSAFLQQGGLHPAQMPGEEILLYSRILDKGWKLFYVPEIEVTHGVKPPAVLIRKAYWYGTGRGGFFVRRPERNWKPSVLLPPLSLLFLSVAGLFSFFHPFAGALLALYLALYGLLMLSHLAFVFRRFSRNPLFWLALPPLAFLFQHAYGLGILVGIVQSMFLGEREFKMPEYFRRY